MSLGHPGAPRAPARDSAFAQGAAAHPTPALRFVGAVAPCVGRYAVLVVDAGVRGGVALEPDHAVVGPAHEVERRRAGAARAVAVHAAAGGDAAVALTEGIAGARRAGATVGVLVAVVVATPSSDAAARGAAVGGAAAGRPAGLLAERGDRRILARAGGGLGAMVLRDAGRLDLGGLRIDLRRLRLVGADGAGLVAATEDHEPEGDGESARMHGTMLARRRDSDIVDGSAEGLRASGP